MRRTHTHTRNSDGGAAIEYLSVSSVFWVYPSVLVLFGRSCCLKNCDCYRHDFFSGATTGVRCAMVCRCGRGWCPGRHSLRFTIHRISRGRRQISNSRRIASGALTQCEHPTSQVRSTPQFQFNPIQKKSFWTSLSIGLNRISIAPQWKCLFGYSFFDQSDSNSLQSNSKSYIGFIVFPSLKQALRACPKQNRNRKS